MTQENIEADYLNEERFYFFKINQRKYMITFYEKSMRQRNMDPSYGTERSVRRRPQFVAESELHSRTRSGSVGLLLPFLNPWTGTGCETSLVDVDLNHTILHHCCFTAPLFQ